MWQVSDQVVDQGGSSDTTSPLRWHWECISAFLPATHLPERCHHPEGEQGEGLPGQKEKMERVMSQSSKAQGMRVRELQKAGGWGLS